MSTRYGDPALALGTLAQRYQLRNAPSVYAFVRNDPALVGLLLEARDQLERWFPDTPTFLEVNRDADAPHACRLCLSVGSTLDVEAVCQALDQFDHHWWLKNLDRACGRLTITVELQ
jgi:hypothetical protein